MSEGKNLYSGDVQDFYGKRRFDRPPANLKKVPNKKETLPDLEVHQGYSREEFAVNVEAIHSVEAREAFEKVCRICEAIKEAGGRALLVGGAVRDEVLGIASKDFDVEVYGLEPEEVEKITKKFGKIKDVGKAFGILKLTNESGFEIDISLPRTDSKIGKGHRGFEVKVDPKMSIAEAAKRRDFTFNALSKDPLTGEIFDPFNGIEDLRTRKLRVTDPELFKDDPLRLLRGAQFVGRFGLSAEPDTLKLMQAMAPELQEISPDRIRDEWEKLLLRSVRPSMGLTLLNNIGVIDEHYPELAALRGSEQEIEWHPEGDVWIHTLMVVDAGRDIITRKDLSGDTARVLMLAALCHDLGKPYTAEVKEGRIKSHGHDVKGEAPTRSFLKRIGTRIKDTDKVAALVREHIWPTAIYLNQKHDPGKRNKLTIGAFHRLAKRLDPATLEELTYLAEADCLGVGPFLDPNNPDQLLMKTVDAYGLEAGRWVREMASKLEVYQEKPKRYVSGRELISLGFVPSNKEGEKFGAIIDLADDCRDLAGMEKEELIRLLLDSKGSVKVAVQKMQEILINAK
ncbi:MAG: CCA tRNA nucleotidyltransferase [Patescibacteria group bacterium]